MSEPTFFEPVFPNGGELDNRFLPDNLRDSISMISPEEKAFLFGLARNHYTGVGSIVDAGIFLGASTKCFAAGLNENDSRSHIREKSIQSYEYGIATDLMIDIFARREIGAGLRSGDSFEHLLRTSLGDDVDMTELHIGDICDSNWTFGPIEILFLDVIKTSRINQHVFTTFFEDLLPGHSIVVQQDYFVDFLPFLKITQESLSPYFDFICAIGPTAAFQLNQTIPPEVLRTASDPDTMSVAQCLELLEAAEIRAVSTERRVLTGLSTVHFLCSRGLADEASSELSRLSLLLSASETSKRLEVAILHAQDAIKRLRNDEENGN